MAEKEPVGGTETHQRTLRSFPSPATASRKTVVHSGLSSSERLQALSTLLANAVTEDAVADAVLTAAIADFRFEVGIIVTRRPGSPRLDLLRCVGNLDPLLWAFARSDAGARGPFTDVIEHPASLHVQSFEDAATRYPALRDIDRGTARRGWIFLPLRGLDDSFGVLAFGFSQASPLHRSEWPFIESIGQLCGLAIDRLRIRAALATTRMAAEIARRLSDEERTLRVRFLRALSYEVRTPLNAVTGYAELLEMGIHGPVTLAQSGSLWRIKKAAASLHRLVGDVLAVARVETPRVGRPILGTRLHVLLARVEEACLPVAEANGVSLRLVAPHPEDYVSVDPERVEQILVNLLGNAVKFTPRGGRAWIEHEKFPGTLKLHVADTGHGIPVVDQERVFEPFARVGDLTSPARRGTGLGLPISRELARAMGGDITVRSDGRTGSVFTLTLPLANAIPRRSGMVLEQQPLTLPAKRRAGNVS